MTNTLPKQAQIIVIGGGIIGCSVAYHLAKEGAKDVLLLERGQLTCGSTFHAAGLVGQLRSSANITRVLKNSVETVPDNRGRNRASHRLENERWFAFGLYQRTLDGNSNDKPPLRTVLVWKWSCSVPKKHKNCGR